MKSSNRVKTHNETKKMTRLSSPADIKAVKEVVIKKAKKKQKDGAAYVVVAVEDTEKAEWAAFWSGVDDQIAWADCCCPLWEMEPTVDAYNALYEDVLWDYDIWGFKSSGSNIAPNP